MSARISAQQLATGLRRELRRKVRQVGVWGTLKHGGAKVLRELRGLFHSGKRRPDPFDLKNGTDTGGVLGVGSLDIPEDQMEHAVRYSAISEDEFVRLLKGLPIDLTRLTFVDLGSGKGRALLLAARLGFKEIIGVELSGMLHQTAERNIKLFQGKNKDIPQIRSIHGDAAAFEMPPVPLLIYLYNPFD